MTSSLTIGSARLCADGCGRPATSIRGNPNFASNDCHARVAAKWAASESERLSRLRASAGEPCDSESESSPIEREYALSEDVLRFRLGLESSR